MSETKRRAFRVVCIEFDAGPLRDGHVAYDGVTGVMRAFISVADAERLVSQITSALRTLREDRQAEEDKPLGPPNPPLVPNRPKAEEETADAG